MFSRSLENTSNFMFEIHGIAFYWPIFYHFVERFYFTSNFRLFRTIYFDASFWFRLFHLTRGFTVPLVPHLREVRNLSVPINQKFLLQFAFTSFIVSMLDPHRDIHKMSLAFGEWMGSSPHYRLKEIHQLWLRSLIRNTSRGRIPNVF